MPRTQTQAAHAARLTCEPSLQHLPRSKKMRLPWFPSPQIVGALGIQLLKSEQSSQQRLVASLESVGAVSKDVIANLRKEALTISDSMKKLLPIYAYYYLHG